MKRLYTSNSIYLIYKHTSLSGKSYIGQTNNSTRRTREHKNNFSNCTAFKHAIIKYGFDAFSTKILAENLLLKEVSVLEEQFIQKHNPLIPNGYNLKIGRGNYQHISVLIPSFQKGKPKLQDQLKCSTHWKNYFSKY